MRFPVNDHSNILKCLFLYYQTTSSHIVLKVVEMFKNTQHKFNILKMY